MSKVSVVATMNVKADKADEFPAAFDALFEHIGANEPGTEHYMLHRSTTDPNEFYMTEIYTDQAALDAHMASDAFATFGASLGDFLEGGGMKMAAPVKTATGEL